MKKVNGYIRTNGINTFYKITGKVPMVLLGNKVDLYKSARVFYDDLHEFGKKYDFPVFLTSAKTGSNVENAFYKLSSRWAEQRKRIC